MSRRPHIAFVIPSMSAGGTERQLMLLMHGLKRECEITLVCTREEGDLFADAAGMWISDHTREVEYARHGVDSATADTRRVRGSGRYTPSQRMKLDYHHLAEIQEGEGLKAHVLHARSGWDFRMRRVMEDIFRENPPDIVHSSLFGFDYWAVRAARDAGVPVAISARRELAQWQGLRHRWLVQRANRMVDVAVANSNAVAEHAARQEGQPGAFYRVIYNGLEDAAFDVHGKADARAKFALPVDGPVVGMAANFSPVKDHALFAAVAAEVRKQVPAAHFVLFGEGRLREAAARSMRDAVGPEHFHLRHTLHDMPKAYASMDVCVLTSRMEGASNALMEAMASGRPVVAPAVGGLPELVAHGETGYLITERRPAAFAERIVELVKHPALAHGMGSAARTRMQTRFSAERMVDEHRTLYLELLAAKGR